MSLQKEAWRSFVHCVVSFKRGMKDAATKDMFQHFLTIQVNRNKDGKEGQKTRKLVGSNRINTSKLPNDLAFWMEMERQG